MNYLIYIYTLQIEEIDINKKPNVGLICGSIKLKLRGVWIENPKKKKVTLCEEVTSNILFFFVFNERLVIDSDRVSLPIMFLVLGL